MLDIHRPLNQNNTTSALWCEAIELKSFDNVLVFNFYLGLLPCGTVVTVTGFAVHFLVAQELTVVSKPFSIGMCSSLTSV